MKVILVGTKHSNKEEGVDVVVEYAGIAHDDDWTFTIGNLEVTVSDLTSAMRFLKQIDGDSRSVEK